ncbi:SAM-dependent methyltransferase [Actinomadura sp. LD22]|uniref:SAM-dependent methyltransferase n=1 Tax=Actinomadura physcomitrii TaxID=2650748 RepID=A0A6I4M7C5_9ACTN|nr:SAM-dependent methyltransferase [Actinomadura physcomitrii]MWA00890.1 SAM-dependent methyltransferase [Actinomadura physcomitrii]
MTEESAPPCVDLETPSPARIYDVFLGGKDNFAVDRAAAQLALQAGPDIPLAARENRAFLGRAVRFAIESGIRQFIDVGTGLPTQGSVHEIAQSRAPEARTVYVDNDPIVLAHARALLSLSDTTTVIQGDLREPLTILGNPRLQELIDFRRPVAVLMLAVLHFATDEEVRDTIAAFHEAMASGSLLVISHGTPDGHPEDGSSTEDAWRNASARIRGRSRDEVQAMFRGFELLEPGVVWVSQWRPDDGDGAGTRWVYCGVGRKERGA